MTILGIIFVLSGIGSIIYGVDQNNRLSSQISSLLNRGTTNPGTTFIIIGVVAIIVGIILVFAGIEKDKEKNRIIRKSMDKNEDIEIDDEWICSKCGKTNNICFSVCEKCGKEIKLNNKYENRNDEISTRIDEYWFCENCGKRNMSHLIKCTKCGKNINEISENNINEQINWEELLVKNGLEKYIEVFKINGLDTIEIINELNELDLEKIGISMMGDRKKILKLFNI